MTNFGDVLSIRGESGSQVVTSIEIFFGGQGDDFLHLADNDFRLNNINAFGSSGNDIIWTNSGNDVLLGEAGNDHLVGGPGNDDLHGGDDDDYLSGGAGDDTLRGGLGSDLLVGGPGSDDYYLLKPRRDISETTIIQESPDGAIDRLIFTSMLQNQFGLVFLRPDDFRFERLGRDLLIIAENEDWAVNALVEGQFSAVGAGLDSVDFISDFSNPRTSVVESIDLRAMFVPEPSTLTLAFAVVGAGAYVRRCRGASIRRGA